MNNIPMTVEMIILLFFVIMFVGVFLVVNLYIGYQYRKFNKRNKATYNENIYYKDYNGNQRMLDPNSPKDKELIEDYYKSRDKLKQELSRMDLYMDKIFKGFDK